MEGGGGRVTTTPPLDTGSTLVYKVHNKYISVSAFYTYIVSSASLICVQGTQSYEYHSDNKSH